MLLSLLIPYLGQGAAWHCHVRSAPVVPDPFPAMADLPTPFPLVADLQSPFPTVADLPAPFPTGTAPTPLSRHRSDR